MSLNDIVFNRGRGGLGRALPGEDHISGIVAEITTAKTPAALTSAGPYNVLYSVQDAEDLGIIYAAGSDNVAIDAIRYAVEMAFEVNPKAVIHLQIADVTDSKTAVAGLILMQNNAGGKVRQAIVLTPEVDFAVGSLAPLQASCDTLEAEHKPLSIIYACNFVGVTTPGGEDLRAQDNKNLSIAFGADGNGTGDALATSYSKSFTNAGTILGVLSGAKVNENIAWVGRFNINKNSTNEFDVAKLADGRLFTALSQSEKDTLNAKGYIFFIKHVGLAGTYFNDSHTAISAADDFAFIENNRTVDKAVRETRTFLLPRLNSPLYVNEDGTLQEETIAGFKNDAERSLENMQTNGEISAFSVSIDPAQNVLSTSKVTIAITIVPVGVARNIVVNIGLAVRITE